MRAILNALDEQHSELAVLLDPLDDAGWQRPTRCEGWTVADVVLHLAQSDELAFASAQGRLSERLGMLAGGLDRQGDVDDGAAAMVAQERGAPNTALLERWRTGAAAFREVLAASDPHQRVDWVAGRVSTQTLATTRLAECWIHTGDVADGLGVTQEPTDRLEHVARLAWRTLPYAFAARRPGAGGPGRLRPAGAERRSLAVRTRHAAGDDHRRPRRRPLSGGRASRRRRRHLAERHRAGRTRRARARAHVRLDSADRGDRRDSRLPACHI